MTQETQAPDVDETPGAMLQRLADDGRAWAEEFCRHFPQVPVDAALGWFCNAIENTWDTRCSRLTAGPQETWDEFRDQVERHREAWAELRSSSPEQVAGDKSRDEHND